MPAQSRTENKNSLETSTLVLQDGRTDGWMNKPMVTVMVVGGRTTPSLKE